MPTNDHAAHFDALSDVEYQCAFGCTKAAMWEWLTLRLTANPPPCPITRYRFNEMAVAE